MADYVNCKADFVFQMDLQVPVAATGVLGTPALGDVTGIKCRLAGTKTGAALHSSVGDLTASERSGVAGRFYVEVEGSLLTSHVLPIGEGLKFYAIWSKANDFDLEAVEYLVANGRPVR